MDKFLFSEYSEKDRENLLKDNADVVENVGYMKSFASGEMDEMKDDLSKVVIELNDISDEKKLVIADFKFQSKPLEIMKKELLGNIKSKAKFVTEICYKFINHEDGEVGYYNKEGILVEDRPIRQDEKQRTIFSINRTGTNDK